MAIPVTFDISELPDARSDECGGCRRALEEIWHIAQGFKSRAIIKRTCFLCDETLTLHLESRKPPSGRDPHG